MATAVPDVVRLLSITMQISYPAVSVVQYMPEAQDLVVAVVEAHDLVPSSYQQAVVKLVAVSKQESEEVDAVEVEEEDVVLVLSVDPLVVDDPEVVLEATVVEAAALAVVDVVVEDAVVVVSDVVLAAVVSEVVVASVVVASLVVEESFLLLNSFSKVSSSSYSFVAKGLQESAQL